MANATILYACTEGGLAILNKPGTLPEWLPTRSVLQNERVTSVWADPGPPIGVAAVVAGQLRVSENGGRTWEVADPGGEPLVLWERDGMIFTALVGGGVAGSRDGGVMWETMPPLPIEITGARYAGVGEGGMSMLVVFTQAGGGRLLVGDPQDGSWQTPLTTATSDAAYVEGHGYFALTPAGIHRGEIDGQEWDEVPGAPSGGRALVAIPGAAGKPPSLLVATPQGLVASADGGESWSPTDLPAKGSITAFARDPERRDRLYAALSTGYLLESGNRGQSWDPVNSQPLAPVTALYAIRI
jgi:hypothetical protein